MTDPLTGAYAGPVQAFFDLAQRRGVEVTYYAGGDLGAPNVIRAIVEYDGAYWDGEVMHTVDGVAVHVPRHPDALLTVAEGDLVDVPMRPGDPASQGRVMRIVSRYEAKFVLEVHN